MHPVFANRQRPTPATNSYQQLTDHLLAPKRDTSPLDNQHKQPENHHRSPTAGSHQHPATYLAPSTTFKTSLIHLCWLHTAHSLTHSLTLSLSLTDSLTRATVFTIFIVFLIFTCQLHHCSHLPTFRIPDAILHCLIG